MAAPYTNTIRLRKKSLLGWDSKVVKGVCFTTAPPVATFTDIIDRLMRLIPKQVPEG